MFNTQQTRIIIILGLLGLLGCFLCLPFLSKVDTLDFKLSFKKEAVFKVTDKFIGSQGIYSKPGVQKAKILSDSQSLIFIQNQLGIKQAQKIFDIAPLYYWDIHYRYGSIFSRKNRIELLVDTREDAIIGYKRFISPSEYESLNNLSKAELERIARDFFKLIRFNIADFKQTRYAPLGKRHIFEWEKYIPYLEKAKLKIKLEILGDKVREFKYFLDIPQENLRIFKINDYVTTFFSLGLFAIVCLFSFIIAIICFFRREQIDWRFGLIFAIFIFVSYSVNFLKAYGYRGSYLILFIGISILAGIIFSLWTLIAAAAAKLFAEKANLNLFPVKISSEILLGYVFFFSGMGLTMVFFVLVMKIFNPIMTLGFNSVLSGFPSTRFSCLIAPLLSLSAAVSEEVFFRAAMILYLKKFFKSFSWPILISTFIWSFMHVSPIASSDIYPNFIQGLILFPIGILFCYIFIKFGLVSAIATHYLHDLFIIGTAYLEFNNFSNIKFNITILLLAAVAPLLVALLCNRLKNV